MYIVLQENTDTVSVLKINTIIYISTHPMFEFKNRPSSI